MSRRPHGRDVACPAARAETIQTLVLTHIICMCDAPALETVALEIWHERPLGSEDTVSGVRGIESSVVTIQCLQRCDALLAIDGSSAERAWALRRHRSAIGSDINAFSQVREESREIAHIPVR